MVNILIINFGEQFGGIEVHLKVLIENLDKKKFNISVIARKNSKFAECISNMIKEGLNIELYCLDISKKELLKSLRLIKGIVINNSIQIVHAHGILASYIYSLVKERDVKFITSTHGYCYYDRINRGKAVISIFNHMEKESLKKAEKCIAVSNDIKEYISEKGISEEKVQVINHGISIKDFKNEIQIKEIDYVTEEEKCIKVKSLGRLEKVKEYDVLIKAVSKCLDNGINLSCEIAGIGEEFEYLSSLIKELNIVNNCKLVGFVTNVEEFLQDADIYVQSSKIESFGISILEAMNNDVPVISSRVGGVTDIIEQGYNGLLFEEGNVNELSKCIIELAKDKEKRKELERKARLKLEQSFNIIDKVKEIENLYIHEIK